MALIFFFFNKKDINTEDYRKKKLFQVFMCVCTHNYFLSRLVNKLTILNQVVNVCLFQNMLENWTI